MLDGLFEMLFAGLFAILLLFGLGVYSAVDYLWLEDTYTSKTLIVPDIRIKTETINGHITSDTSYVYHLK